jgi:pimeloyl-ACP methyl ester carboxylesterase
MRELFIDVAGLRISALYRSGNRRTVVLVHGNSSCKDIFQNQLDTLSTAGFPILVPDLPGHGGSENARVPHDTYSFPGYAEILIGLLNSLRIGACHVVGWSLGGHVGLELWHRYDRISSLLISGTPPIVLSAEGAACGFIASSLMDLAGTRDFGPDEVIAYGSAMLGQTLTKQSGLAQMIARTDGEARYWMVKNGLAGRGINQIDAIRNCTRPIAIVQGRRDAFVNIDYLRGLPYRNLWLGRPILLDAGHAPHWESPQIFNDYMIRFFKKVD